MPRPGDFCLSRGPGVRGAVIRWWTGSPMSHAALYVGSGRVVQAMWSGVEVTDVWGLGAAAWSHLDLSDRQRALIVEYAHSLVGLRYGWGTAVAAALRCKGFGAVADRMVTNGAVTCTQLVAGAYLLAGLPLVPIDPAMVTPAHLCTVLGVVRDGTMGHVRRDAGRVYRRT